MTAFNKLNMWITMWCRCVWDVTYKYWPYVRNGAKKSLAHNNSLAQSPLWSMNIFQNAWTLLYLFPFDGCCTSILQVKSWTRASHLQTKVSSNEEIRGWTIACIGLYSVVCGYYVVSSTNIIYAKYCYRMLLWYFSHIAVSAKDIYFRLFFLFVTSHVYFNRRATENVLCCRKKYGTNVRPMSGCTTNAYPNDHVTFIVSQKCRPHCLGHTISGTVGPVKSNFIGSPKWFPLTGKHCPAVEIHIFIVCDQTHLHTLVHLYCNDNV